VLEKPVEDMQSTFLHAPYCTAVLTNQIIYS